jgi:hypothetical protein
MLKGYLKIHEEQPFSKRAHLSRQVPLPKNNSSIHRLNPVRERVLVPPQLCDWLASDHLNRLPP